MISEGSRRGRFVTKPPGGPEITPVGLHSIRIAFHVDYVTGVFMREDRETSELTRRRFVQLSGVTGASALLAGTGALAGSNLAAAAQPSGPVQPGGPPADCSGFPQPCGSDTDDDPIWNRVKGCNTEYATAPTPKTLSSTSCPVYDDPHGCVVLYGRRVPPGGQAPTHNFLLVPTIRIMGIECPTIVTNPTPNYWQSAWFYANNGGTLVTPNVNVRDVPGNTGVGLGVNSVGHRGDCQLHIHMAGVYDGVKDQLHAAFTAGQVATTVVGWRSSRVNLTGSFGGQRTYRVLKWPSISSGANNPFVLLSQMLPGQGLPGGESMGEQTLVVTHLERTMAAPAAEGFYLVNSNISHLPNGIGTGDQLLERDL